MSDKGRGRETFSYLVRLWRERDDAGEAADGLRGYIRNLRTGKEQYLGDPDSIADYLVSDAREEDARDEARKADAS